MSLTLMQCHPDPYRLAVWARREGLDAEGDLGYALHALLMAAFNESAPKPFRYFGDARGLLAYTTCSAEHLQLAAQTASTPDAYAALGLEQLATRVFPTVWEAGRRLGFEVRLRPVVRTKDGRERDVFLAEIEKHADSGEAPSRETVYAQWLTSELARDDAAKLESVSIEKFQISACLRKEQKEKDKQGKRPIRSVRGPDVVFSGVLTVNDPARFAALLERGLGRHRAFGFGMLLLRPVAPC